MHKDQYPSSPYSANEQSGGRGREEVQSLQSPMGLICESFVREMTAATKDLQILLLGNSHVFRTKKGSKP